MREPLQHPVRCPNCLSNNPLARSVTGPAPTPQDGDAGLCFTCGEVMIFDRRSKGRARQPTPDEQAELDADVRVQRLRRAWKEAVS